MISVNNAGIRETNLEARVVEQGAASQGDMSHLSEPGDMETRFVAISLN